MSTVIVDPDSTLAETLRAAVAAGSQVLNNLDQLRRLLESDAGVDAVVIGPSIDADQALQLAESQRVTRPTMGIVLVRRRIETSLLRDALKAGVREVVTDRDLAGVSNAVQRTRELAQAIRGQLGDGAAPGEGPRTGVLVTVFAAKGGCGKTTVATNLAAALAQGGRHEVCLVDLDLAFGDVAIALQLFPSHTIADAVALGTALDAPSVAALLTPHSPGLQALVAPIEPGIAESIPGETITGILRVLKQQFQYVVVDSPPAFTDHVLAAFDQSDVVALLATLDIPALKNLKLTLETLDLLNYPSERWRVVLNRSDSKVGLAIADVEKTLQSPIAVEIPSSRDVPATINRGVPIVLDAPNHPVSVAIRQFAEKYVIPLSTSGPSAIPGALRNDRRNGMLRRKAKR